MRIIERETGGEHERVLLAHEPEVGYRGVIAVHSTALGPAVGGTRFWNYATEDEAVTDALRLARGMTYKNALAGIPFGGGKSVIIGDHRTREREPLFRAHGRFVETLGGSYITAEDVGTSPSDIAFVNLETSHVAGLLGRSGDPSPVTARGVFRAIQASAKWRWGTEELRGRRVALQGCGSVGRHLARERTEAGASVFVSDTDEEKVSRVVSESGAKSVAPEEIFDAEADIFAPCALGGVLNDETIPRLKVEVVAGAANNQLLEPRHGDALEARGILYAPDYAANAGGIINGCRELLGWDRAHAHAKVEELYDTLLRIYALARSEGVPTHLAADRLAEQRLRDAKRA
ncbi:MAG TPA: Glu/Leu/Phe/Val dehydrogenase [Pyrinomonadaceae bacterium]|nr:Glu/Leu/Phe/Val dehydrogenase [Pyrinomonadaceae bacterium]